jgi:hypothetical protein
MLQPTHFIQLPAVWLIFCFIIFTRAKKKTLKGNGSWDLIAGIERISLLCLDKVADQL